MLKSVKLRTDERGTLIVFENKENLDFVPVRSYVLLNNFKNRLRGSHAHIKLNQFLVCLSGSCSIKIVDKNLNEKNYDLNSPDEGLRIKPISWREITYMSRSCVILVSCDREYELDDYIHDYKKFKELCLTF